MTRMQELHEVMRPYISQVHETGFETDILMGNFCPADRMPCGHASDRKCLACWNREAEGVRFDN